MITKEQLKEKLDEKYTNEQLAAYFNCSITTIKRRKKEFDLVGYKTNAKPLSISELQKVESLCNSGYNLKEVAKQVGRSPATLKLYIPSNLHKALVANSFAERSTKMQKTSFSKLIEPTKDTAYMLGYLVADGNISAQGSIKASSIDLELIQHFARYFDSNILISGVTSANNIVYTSSAKDFKLLEKVKLATNLVPNKTYMRYIIPQWVLSDSNFLNYFIVGLFNGDGWAYKVIGRDNTVEIGMTMHSAQEEFLKEIAEYIGLNKYNSKTRSITTISSKNKATVQKFAHMYCKNEYALSRKAEILLRYSLAHQEIGGN